MENDKIKNLLFGTLILALFVTAYSVYSYSETYADSMMSRSFSVTGEAKLKAVPDISEFDFGVLTEGGKDVVSSQTKNTEKMNKIMDYLKSQKIEAKDIKTTGYSIEPRYQNSPCEAGLVCPPAEIVGYTVRQNATVKIRDFKLIGDLLTGVVKNGANNVSQLRFTFDDYESLVGQVKGEAVKKAQLKAKALSRTAGFRLGKLLSIEEAYSPYANAPMGFGGGADMVMSKSAMAPVVAPTIEPGSQELTASVVLRYGIK